MCRRHWPKELYVPVGLCILSQCEYLGEFSKFLRRFHQEMVGFRLQGEFNSGLVCSART
jgi:hypothetical protein